MSFCVNIESPAFKETAKRLDIAEGQLENIVHEYMNFEGKTDLFPSDEYILSKINGNPIALTSQQVELRDSKYAEPMLFDTVEEFNQTKQELLTYFPEEAIGESVTHAGKYRLQVAEIADSDSLQEMERIKEQAIADGTFMKAPNGKDSNLNEQQWLQVRTKAFKAWFGDWEKDPANASKVVDENGEPLVVYTGVPIKGITGFSLNTPNRASLTSFLKKGIYFSDKNTASLYTKGKPVYRTNQYVNEEQARKINTWYYGEGSFNEDGADFVGLPIDTITSYINEFTSEVTGELDNYYIPRGEVIPAFLNVRNPITADAGGKVITKLTKNDVERINNSEGAIIYHVDEHTRDDLTITDSTDYIVFNPSQIKSAVNNDGTFTVEDNNIYQEGERQNQNQARDTRLDELIKKEDVSVNDLLSLVDSSSEYSGIIELLKTKKDGRTPLLSGVNVKLIEGNQSGLFDKSRAFYSAKDKTIYINTLANYRGGRADSVIMHEVMHAITVNRIINNRPYRAEFDRIISEYQKNFYNQRYSKTGLNKEMASYYMEEFIADVWSNIDTINNLKNIKVNTRQTLWDKIKRFFTKIFSGSDGTLMAQASDAIYRLLDQPELVSASGNYREGETLEVSTAGDEFGKRFSAFNAKFKQGTVIDGVDVSGRSIEDVYQNVVKKSGKGRGPAADSRLNRGFNFFSGGAIGSDAFWSNTAKRANVQTTDYTVKDYESLSQERKDSVEREYQEVVSRLGRRALGKDTYSGKLVRRDMLQADSADAIFAVGKLSSNGLVDGGTGYATTRGIIRGIPVHLFDQTDNVWKVWDSIQNRFVTESTPELTKNAAVVGTRQLQDSGKRAIIDIVNNLKDSNEKLSYQEGYLPLWQEWARQNPELIEQLRQRAEGKVLTDKFANTRVSQARALTEILEQTESSVQVTPKVEEVFQEKSKDVVSQINSLIESTNMSITEVRDEAKKMMDWISDQLTKYQQNPEGTFDKYFKSRYENETPTEEQRAAKIDEISKMSRKQLVEAIGIDEIIYMYSEEGLASNNLRDIRNNRFLKQNMSGLVQLGYSRFVTREGFGIILSEGNEGMFTTADTKPADEQTDPDDFNGFQDSDKDSDENGNQQDHWQIESKTRAILDGASELVRQAVSECYILEPTGKLNEDGTPEYKIKTDSRGRNERVDQRTAVRSMVSWVQGAITMQGMIDRLSAKEKTNPWVSQIITRLKDTSGKESDFQNQFFTVFRKDFQPYSIVIKKDGKYIVMSPNINPASREAMKSIDVQFRLGKLPLFNNIGVDSKGLSEFKALADELEAVGDITEANKGSTTTIVGKMLMYIGFPQPSDAVERVLDTKSKNLIVSNAKEIVTRLENQIGSKTYQPFKYDGNKTSIKLQVTALIKPFTDALDDVGVSSIYDSGKMYQSYITPSYTTKLFNKMHLPEKEFYEFIKNEFATSEWFYRGKGTSVEELSNPDNWRMPWMKELASMSEEDRLKAFIHRVQLNFNKKNYMKGMTGSQYTMSVLSEFFGDTAANVVGETTYAYYRFPMLSNKPSNEFIRFIRYKGNDYQRRITDGFLEIFSQELSRIQSLKMADLKKGDEGYIENFNERGKHFVFLEYLDDYINGDKVNTELGELLTNKIAGKAVDEVRLSKLVRDEITNYLNGVANNLVKEYKANGIFEAMKKIANIPQTDAMIEKAIRNFAWNDTYASANILELLVTDKAFYKDEEDLQKRLAQVHSPGRRGNPDAIDYDGHRVSDGKIRIVKVADFKNILSNTIDNVSEVFDRRIENASEEEKAGWRALKEQVVDALHGINATDGQAFSSPTGFRKKGIAFGEWSRDAEEVYNELKKGNYNLAKLKSIFNPKKPFTYSRVHTKLNTILDTPIKTFLRPVQFKDSEYLLIMADALTRNEKTSGPNLLKALFDIMENTAEEKPRQGIDFIVFDSGVKSGLQGAISINEFVENAESGEAGAYGKIKSRIINADGSYNTNYVDEVDFEDYTQQQNVPEHFMDHSDVQWGSQVRVITPSDLEVSYLGQPVRYEFFDPAENKWKSLGKDDMRAEWEETTRALIQTSVDELNKELGLDNNELTKKDRNIIVAKILQKEILSNERYGIDLLLACSVDENGEFRIPLGDPIQAKRVEQLLNSVIKNRINRQKIAGGTLVEVTNFGATERLERRYKHKNGGLLKAKREYLAEGHSEDDFKKYVAENQNGIAYDECYAPAWMLDIYRHFTDDAGNVDIEGIEMLDPDLLKMFGYRIPTEDKYSTAPYKIVGFLPKEAGDGFMQPYDTTVIDGSDFDVDKKNLMRKALELKEKIKGSPKAADLYDSIAETVDITTSANSEILAQAMEDVSFSGRREGAENKLQTAKDRALRKRESAMKRALKLTGDELKQASEAAEEAYNKAVKDAEEEYKVRLSEIDIDEKEAIEKRVLSLMLAHNGKYVRKNSSTIPTNERKLFSAVKKAFYDAKYEVEVPTEGRDYYNNKIFDMQWAIATHASSADKYLNPGNFDQQKRMGYIVEAYRNGLGSWDTLQSMSTDDLKKLVKAKKNLMDFSVQTAFYEQNSVAGQILGIFAVAKSAHAMFESRKYAVTVKEPFKIAGKDFFGLMELDKMYDDSGVNRIGKTLGSLVSASADAVKDPVLNLMHINNTTVNVLNTALRLGMDFDDAALLLSSQVISECLAEFNKKTLAGWTSFNDIVADKIREFKDALGIDEDSPAFHEELTREELIRGILPYGEDTSGSVRKAALKTLLAYQKLAALAMQAQPLNNISRLNSVQSAVGPQIIHTISQRQKLYRDMEDVVKLEDSYYTEDGPVAMGDVIGGITVSPETLPELMRLGVVRNVPDAIPVTFESVLSDIPSLGAFYEGYTVSDKLMKEQLNMPAASEKFEEVYKSLNEEGHDNDRLMETVMSDPKLFSSLLDFFQSYVLLQSGVIEETQLSDYTKEFAKRFIQQGFKEKYPDNAFIQAIQFDTVGDSDNVVLKLETTGMEQAEKDALSAGWIQLEKDNPELSHKLFAYNFFRTGIGFSPKSFMGLVPIQVKEKIVGKSGVRYVDVYRNLPDVEADNVISMWLRNNWSENKLVPRIDNITKIAALDKKTWILTVDSNSYTNFAGHRFVKGKVEGRDVLFKRISEDTKDCTAEYQAITPLGHNGDYFECSMNPNYVAMDSVPMEASAETEDNGMVESQESVDVPAVKTKEEVTRSLQNEMNRLLRESSEEGSSTQARAGENAVLKKAEDLGITVDKQKFDEQKKEYC